MSKLIKEIYAVDSGKREYKTQFNFSEVRSAWAADDNLLFKKYSIMVKMGADVLVRDDDNLTEATKAVKMAVAEEIFGEFRAPISELRVALWQKNFDLAIEALSRLEHKMFVEGIHD